MDAVETRVLSEREFERRHGDNLRGAARREDGVYVIELPRGYKTVTRLHELAHIKLGHCDEIPEDIYGMFRHELEAQKWVDEKMGRKTSLTGILNIISSTIILLFRFNHRPTTIFSYINWILWSSGYIEDKKDSSCLWWWLRNYYEDYKDWVHSDEYYEKRGLSLEDRQRGRREDDSLGLQEHILNLKALNSYTVEGCIRQVRRHRKDGFFQ